MEPDDPDLLLISNLMDNMIERNVDFDLEYGNGVLSFRIKDLTTLVKLSSKEELQVAQEQLNYWTIIVQNLTDQ